MFEWKQNAHKKGKTTICIKSWSYLKVGSMWKLNTVNDFPWYNPQALLEKYIIDADQTGDVLFSLSKLKQLGKKRQEKEQKKKGTRKEKRKKVRPKI